MPQQIAGFQQSPGFYRSKAFYGVISAILLAANMPGCLRAQVLEPSPVVLVAPPPVLEAQPVLRKSTWARSVIKEGKSGARISRETANRQIRETKNEPEEIVKTGEVVVSEGEKQAISSMSPAVIPDTLEDRIQLPAAKLGRPTVALALGGGGARGAAHIGVLKVLEENDIPIDYIVGTSIGSIIGGAYAAGVSLDQMREIALSGKVLRVYKGRYILLKIVFLPLEKIFHPFSRRYPGVYSGDAFDRYLQKQIPLNVVNLQDTAIPFEAVATNLVDGKAYRISTGRMSTALRASASIPPLLQPVAIEDKLFIDGGLRANTPAYAARDTGAGLVIAVSVDKPLTRCPPAQFRKPMQLAGRLLDVLLDSGDERQIPYADIVIRPNIGDMDIFSSKRTDTIAAMAAGEEAARKALPEIKKRLGMPLVNPTAASAAQDL